MSPIRITIPPTPAMASVSGDPSIGEITVGAMVVVVGTGFVITGFWACGCETGIVVNTGVAVWTTELSEDDIVAFVVVPGVCATMA